MSGTLKAPGTNSEPDCGHLSSFPPLSNFPVSLATLLSPQLHGLSKIANRCSTNRNDPLSWAAIFLVQ